MKQILAISLVIVMVFSMSACGNKKTETIRFAVSRHDQVSLAILASEKGFFKEQGLDVEVTYLPTGVECYQALISNSADIATTMDVVIANMGFTGNTNVSVVASINTTASTCIIARKSSGIETPEDLRGKKLALSPGTSSEVYAANFMKKYDLSDDIEIVKMQTNTISAGIISNSVDAISAWGPFLYNAKKALGEDAVLFRGASIFDVLLGVNKDYANENRDNVIRFIKAIEKAANFALDNKSEAQEIVARITNLDIDAIEDVWEYHDFTISLGAENLERVVSIGEYYKDDEANRGKAFPDYSTYFDYSFMEELNEED